MPTEDAATELEAAAEAFFKEGDGEVPPTGEGEPGSGETSPVGDLTPEGETPEATPIQHDHFEWEDGFKLTKDQARSYAELESFLAANPETAAKLSSFLAGEAGTETQGTTPPAKVEAPALFEVDEFTDPAVKALYERQQQLDQELAAIRAKADNASDVITSQQEMQTEALLDRATASFQKQNGLDDNQMEMVAAVTARLQILPSLMSPVDPISGAVRKVDPLAAIEEAYNLAYWQIPEFRDRAIANEVEAKNKDRQRKAKLSSLSGSSGSIPRDNPAPKTEHERRNAMIAEVAQMIEGN